MPAVQPSLVAEGNIPPSRFVITGSGDFSALVGTANAATIGISQEGGRTAPIPDVSTVYAAISGESLKVYGDGEDCLLELGGTVAAGGRIKAGSAGVGVAVATTGTTNQEAGAVALEGGDDGDIIRVRVERVVVRPAIA